MGSHGPPGLTTTQLEERNQAKIYEVLIPCREDRPLAALVFKPKDGTFTQGPQTKFNLFAVTGISAD